MNTSEFTSDGLRKWIKKNPRDLYSVIVEGPINLLGAGVTSLDNGTILVKYNNELIAQFVAAKISSVEPDFKTSTDLLINTSDEDQTRLHFLSAPEREIGFDRFDRAINGEVIS